MQGGLQDEVAQADGRTHAWVLGKSTALGSAQGLFDAFRFGAKATVAMAATRCSPRSKVSSCWPFLARGVMTHA